MKDVIEQSKQLNTRIKQSAEYRKYLDTKRVLYDNKELYNQLRDFRNRNNAIQAKQSGDIFDEINRMEEMSATRTETLAQSQAVLQERVEKLENQLIQL